MLGVSSCWPLLGGLVGVTSEVRLHQSLVAGDGRALEIGRGVRSSILLTLNEHHVLLLLLIFSH